MSCILIYTHPIPELKNKTLYYTYLLVCGVVGGFVSACQSMCVDQWKM